MLWKIIAFVKSFDQNTPGRWNISAGEFDFAKLHFYASGTKAGKEE
ncbi:MAG: hypothetical protein WAR78_06310 [Ferruginibacter sp.]